MWDLPGPGLKPVSPAFAGRFLTTAPTGQSPLYMFDIFHNKLIKGQKNGKVSALPRPPNIIRPLLITCIATTLV